MKLDKPFDVRAYGIFRCALLLVFTFAMSHAAAAATPAALTPVSGGGQVATVGGAFPQTLSARVTDAAGAPIAGVDVGFQIDECNSIAGGSPCPPESVYPYFGDHEYGIVATTDANGIATTPALTAGSELGAYRVFAMYIPQSVGGVTLSAYYALWQVGGEIGVPITSAFTGAWYDPAQSGHGLLIEVLPSNMLLAYWFAFTPDGSQQAPQQGAPQQVPPQGAPQQQAPQQVPPQGAP